jgi:Flp pilus assembly protein TadG
MRWLNQEDGAVAVIVGILLFVLVGVSAFVVDVGNLYWERRQLQNAADSGALAAAQERVNGGSVALAFSTARTYADANNSRGAFLREGEFETTESSVTVVARTGSQAAEGELRSILAGVLGVDRYASSARATAAWSGSVAGGETIPIAICNRAWEYWTNLNGLPSGPPAHYVSFGGAASSPASTCNNPSFDTYSGGFGFLSRNAQCRATTRLDEKSGHTWVKGNTGNNPQDPQGSTCTTNQMYQMFKDIIDGNQNALIPIFDAYNNKTNEFRLVGYGAFQLVGYDINASVGDSYYKMAKNECGQAVGPPNNASCLKGYFTHFVSLDGELGGPSVPNFGASVIRLTE